MLKILCNYLRISPAVLGVMLAVSVGQTPSYASETSVAESLPAEELSQNASSNSTQVAEVPAAADFSGHVEKPTQDLTQGPPSHPPHSPLQGGMAEDEAFDSRKGENSKPLSLQERGLERGFPHPVNSKPAADTPPIRTLDEINSSTEDLDNMSQVTSVSQLTDVDPTHWAFQALQSLVERYGCIEGYPDRTYRGNRALTRYEFAAGLNACLDRIQELIAAAVSDLPSREDIATIRRLQEEFAAELATLRGRVDALEARAAELEANQFSTTTKLAGEVIFAAAGIAAGENAFGGDIDRVPILGHRTRLNFETSFSGKDLLRTRLQAGNLDAFSANSTLTPEGDLFFAGDPFGTGDNDIVLDELSYTFPLSDRTEVVLAANAAGSDSFVDTLNPFFDGDGASGALSRFGTRHGIYYLADGTGIGIRHQFADSVELSLGYSANSDTVSNPLDGNGLFNGPYAAIAQLTFKPSENFKFGLTYVNSYNTDLGTGSRIANLRSYLADSNDTALASSGLAGSDLPISSNSYGFGLSWRITPGFAIGGWAGYTKTRTLSTLGGQINRGDIDIFNGAVTLAFPDLGKKGNLAGIIFGIEPIADASARLSTDLNRLGLGGDDDDVSFHVEALYQIQVTDNIAITPGVIWLTAPDHNNNNDDVIIGTIRTTFTF